MSESKNCAQHEEKLSAYLDGRLSADQMAEVAAHLQSCSVCSALLEKMAGLDKLATESFNDFDDAVLSDLERKIADKIEALPSPGAVDNVHKSRIFPLWQKYIAVAASIAVLFLVGRMAFKENVPPLHSPQLEAPAVRSTTPVDTQPSPDLKKSPIQNQPIVIPAPQSTKSEMKQDMAVQKEAAVRQTGLQSTEEGALKSKDALMRKPAVEQHLTGEMQSVATAKEAPVSISPTAGEKEKANLSPEKSGPDLNQSIEVQGIATTSTAPPNEKPALKDQLYDKATRKIRGGRSGSATYYVDGVNYSGTLQSSYREALVSYIQSSPAKGGQGFAAKSRGSAAQDTLSAVKALLQTLQNETVQPGLPDSLKALYLQSCAHYDIYRLSGQQEHYATALRLKDSLQQMTVERIDTTAATAYLKAYLQEIEALQLTQ